MPMPHPKTHTPPRSPAHRLVVTVRGHDGDYRESKDARAAVESRLDGWDVAEVLVEEFPLGSAAFEEIKSKAINASAEALKALLCRALLEPGSVPLHAVIERYENVLIKLQIDNEFLLPNSRLLPLREYGVYVHDYQSRMPNRTANSLRTIAEIQGEQDHDITYAELACWHAAERANESNEPVRVLLERASSSPDTFNYRVRVGDRIENPLDFCRAMP
jgi:hypothetical protein